MPKFGFSIAISAENASRLIRSASGLSLWRRKAKPAIYELRGISFRKVPRPRKITLPMAPILVTLSLRKGVV